MGDLILCVTQKGKTIWRGSERGIEGGSSMGMVSLFVETSYGWKKSPWGSGPGQRRKENMNDFNQRRLHCQLQDVIAL